MLVTLRHSLSDEQRKTINDKYTQHLIKAMAFRDAYNANIEEAEKEWGRKRQKEHEQILGHLESSALMSPFTSHAHLDMQMQTPCKVQVFGVCCEPLSRQVFFLIDEAEQAGKGAVVMVSLVHAFHLHGLEERRVTLQANNCVGQNKNTTMMWYLAWWVITGQHDTIQLNFMLPGHTKFRPNSYFGLFKKYYRRQDHVSDMDDLADCVRQCGQDVTYLAIGRKPHRGDHAEGWMAIKDIKDAYQSQVMPPVITTSGLFLTRSLYLYERAQGPTLVMLHPYQKATNLDLQLPFLTHLLLRPVLELQNYFTQYRLTPDDELHSLSHELEPKMVVHRRATRSRSSTNLSSTTPNFSLISYRKLLLKHLTATLATYEASVKDCKVGPALGSYEQEEDALIEQLVTAVIASQQRALLTQGCAAARSSCQETKCAEETHTEPSYFDTLVARNKSSVQARTRSQMDPLPRPSPVMAATQDPLDGCLKDEQNDTLLAYQHCYHQCVERCSVLEAQVSRYSSLLGRLEVAMALKNKVLALFKENVSSLDHHSTDRETWIWQVTALSQRTEDLTIECSELRVLWEGAKRDNEQLRRGCAHFLASWSVERALVRSHEEEQEKLKAELNSKASEVSDGKKEFARYHSVFKRSQQEYQETLEFSDAERNCLLLSINEMEAQRVHATALAADAAAEEEVLEEEEDAVAGELERERGGRGGVDGGGGEGEGEDGRRERGDSGASDEQSEADDRRGACSDNTACATATRGARGYRRWTWGVYPSQQPLKVRFDGSEECPELRSGLDSARCIERILERTSCRFKIHHGHSES
eukprot:Em0009g6a